MSKVTQWAGAVPRVGLQAFASPPPSRARCLPTAPDSTGGLRPLAAGPGGSGCISARGRRGEAVQTAGGCPGGRADDAPVSGAAKLGGGASAGFRRDPRRRERPALPRGLLGPSPTHLRAEPKAGGGGESRAQPFPTAPDGERQQPLTSLATRLGDRLP